MRVHICVVSLLICVQGEVVGSENSVLGQGKSAGIDTEEGAWRVAASQIHSGKGKNMETSQLKRCVLTDDSPLVPLRSRKV